MSHTSIVHSDSENDDANEHDSANQPLLLPSTTSPNKSKNCSTKSIVNLPANNQQSAKSDNVFSKLVTKFNRIEYRRSHRDKWNRINIGILTISFLSVVYFCVSMNLNVDKPAPQIIVDVPPVDTNLLGPKGTVTDNAIDSSIVFFSFFFIFFSRFSFVRD